MPAINQLPHNLSEAFQYLDCLRESGETNMFGVGPYVEGEFGYDRSQSRAVVLAWMDTFDGEKSAADRAAKARGETA